jgi:hypothetical protein
MKLKIMRFDFKIAFNAKIDFVFGWREKGGETPPRRPPRLPQRTNITMTTNDKTLKLKERQQTKNHSTVSSSTKRVPISFQR